MAKEEKNSAKAKAGSGGGAKETDPSKMSKEEWIENYTKAMQKNRPKQAYKFPDTIEEQRKICEAAEELKSRGNEFYQVRRRGHDHSPCRQSSEFVSLRLEIRFVRRRPQTGMGGGGGEAAPLI